MFENIGFGELFLIIIVLIVFFGPKRIPDIAQSIGKGIREFKKAMKDVQDEVSKSINEAPRPASRDQKSVSPPDEGKKLTEEKHSRTEAKL